MKYLAFALTFSALCFLGSEQDLALIPVPTSVQPAVSGPIQNTALAPPPAVVNVSQVHERNMFQQGR